MLVTNPTGYRIKIFDCCVSPVRFDLISYGQRFTLSLPILSFGNNAMPDILFKHYFLNFTLAKAGDINRSTPAGDFQYEHQKDLHRSCTQSQATPPPSVHLDRLPLGKRATCFIIISFQQQVFFNLFETPHLAWLCTRLYLFGRLSLI